MTCHPAIRHRAFEGELIHGDGLSKLKKLRIDVGPSFSFCPAKRLKNTTSRGYARLCTVIPKTV